MQNKYEPPVTQCELGYVCNFYPTCKICPYFAQGIKVKPGKSLNYSAQEKDKI